MKIWILAINAIRDLHSQVKIDCNEPLRVMFNGAIRYPETMINLFEAAGNTPQIEILIYGYPSGKDGELILEKAREYNNIKYMGPYNYNDVPNLYSNADIVWGVYPANDFNVKYAISNKYHESIAYGIPGIYANGTMLGEMVKDSKIGFTVDAYSVKSIKLLFEELIHNNNLLNTVKENLLKHREETHLDWDSEFQAFKDFILRIK